MTYATGGSGGTLVDLMDALRTFALGEGWTIDKWDSTNRLLFMTKGLCTVTMRGDISQTNNVYYGANGSGTFTATADHRLYFAMGTSNTAGSANYYGHPGSPVTTNTDNDAPFCNGLNGPYLAWHFFSDPTVSDHIHCVVQIGAELYKHFSIGHVDPKGLTHAGVAYVTACPSIHFRSTSVYVGNANGQSNDPSKQHYPFLMNGVGTGVQYNGVASYDEAPSMILKHSDAWPAGWLGPVAYASGSGTLRGTILPLLYAPQMYLPSVWPTQRTRMLLLDCVMVGEPAPYSNVVPLFPIPVMRAHYDTSNANSRRICYVGDFPNVRACNMTNLIPGQELVYGSDTYKVFPALRQAPWTDRQTNDQAMTGMHAIAYKKVA